VAMFLGIADLSDDERKNFLDEWLTRAAKVHDDDFTLHPGRMMPPTSPTTRLTAAQYQLSQQASRDAPDTR